MSAVTVSTTASPRVYVHRCGRGHRAWPALAHCVFRDAAWVSGDGPFAVVVWCGVTHVSLHPDEPTAREELKTIGASGCGGRCTRDHELVRLDLDGQQTDDRRGHVGRPRQKAS